METLIILLVQLLDKERILGLHFWKVEKLNMEHWKFTVEHEDLYSRSITSRNDKEITENAWNPLSIH